MRDDTRTMWRDLIRVIALFGAGTCTLAAGLWAAAIVMFPTDPGELASQAPLLAGLLAVMPALWTGCAALYFPRSRLLRCAAVALFAFAAFAFGSAAGAL